MATNPYIPRPGEVVEVNGDPRDYDPTGGFLRILSDAEAVNQLRQHPGFIRIMTVLRQAVDVAHRDMELNLAKDMAWSLQRRWLERKQLVDFVDAYMSALEQQRRDVAADLMRELGFDQATIDRNRDFSFTHLDELLKTGGH